MYYEDFNLKKNNTIKANIVLALHSEQLKVKIYFKDTFSLIRSENSLQNNMLMGW